MERADNIIVETLIGKLGIWVENDVLSAIRFLPKEACASKTDNGFAHEVVRQIHAYLKDPSWQFDIPYVLKGTAFQKRIWDKLTTIPKGQTCFYGDIARDLKTSPRAVGGACRNNPVPIIVPCHRVLSKSGLGGYDGDWETGKVDIKSWLLRHEGAWGLEKKMNAPI